MYSIIRCYFWPGTSLLPLYLGSKETKVYFPHREFPLSAVYSWSRGSIPFTALNVGRRGWRSCPCPMLRLLLWEVRVLFIPLIRWPDEWVNICASASHTEFSLWSSHDIYACLWNCPLTHRKPSSLSNICLQMTTVRVRVTLMTGSKVSDSFHTALERCYISQLSSWSSFSLFRI